MYQNDTLQYLAQEEGRIRPQTQRQAACRGAARLHRRSDKQVIRLICQQKTSKEIGRELFLSGRTIEKCRLEILEKMGERTTIGIVIHAIRSGLLTIE